MRGMCAATTSRIIFQEPMTSLNPLHTIEKQIGEILLLHQGMQRRRRRARGSLELLTQVGIPEPETPARRAIRTSCPAASASA